MHYVELYLHFHYQDLLIQCIPMLLRSRTEVCPHGPFEATELLEEGGERHGTHSSYIRFQMAKKWKLNFRSLTTIWG